MGISLIRNSKGYGEERQDAGFFVVFFIFLPI